MSRRKKKGGEFFKTSNQRSEISELKKHLNESKTPVRKDAVKKVIAFMTCGTDVSPLFNDVVKSINTPDLELKKLVYLYIINYARKQPDAAIKVVNTFRKDAQNPDPLIRALAIRTMGCIRIPKIAEHLTPTLKLALRDKDDYVKKTAAICVVKLFDIDKNIIFKEEFVPKLRALIQEGNPMVVFNAVAALTEIGMKTGKDVFEMNSNLLSGLAAALSECNEWGQVYLLDALAAYEPSEKEAANILQRVSPQLKHKNSAVSMSAIKVIMKYLPLVEDKTVRKLSLDAMRPPLITLLNHSIHPPEIQYVALRNINLIIQKFPEMLTGFQYLKEFFCEYNDPIYVKIEKLEIMVRLASNTNIDLILTEFKSYAKEADTEFVRKAVRAIGRCAIKLPEKAQKCVEVLLELIKTGVNYVVQEGIIVIKDIFRKYPNKYEQIIGVLCDNLDSLDEPEAKASMVWIIGEYSARIENSMELLKTFADNFEQEGTQVQLAILTAVVKLFLYMPEEAGDFVREVLNICTTKIDNPDLRDRGFVYWRLLYQNPKTAEAVVLGRKPEISDQTFQIETKTLDVLLGNINTLSSIFHKPPAQLVKGGRTTSFKTKGDNQERATSSDDDSSDSSSDSDEDGSSSDSDDEEEEQQQQGAKAQAAAVSTDILGMGGGETSAPPVDMSNGTATAKKKAVVVLSADRGQNYQGLEVAASFEEGESDDDYLQLNLIMKNSTDKPLTKFLFKFNSNFLGLQATNFKPPAIAPGATIKYSCQLSDEGKLSPENFGQLQAALKTQLGKVAFFYIPFTNWELLFDEDEAISDAKEFLGKWEDLRDFQETLTNATATDADSVLNKLKKIGMRKMAYRSLDTSTGHACMFLSSHFKDEDVLIEIEFKGGGLIAHCKCDEDMQAMAVLKIISAVLSS
mmetsp:Transcript_21906/g.38858  ORF Transcript_21906/g.38858 Transcript_21906/m.38858 type:complete len:911 (+) Transcript_21906:192-2924(+)|eukprot:CAMPEP_0197533164 /NCGR_PEP_ID=MMETSP1318-20131121/42512_1 /TAXON_ID=552666 /ORGANISM="Partenskyella glossopodia, Strain RCC365" /LENGTH=910 /DNA_ID=CAMNT_0043089967 /DNA_START=192 /DNA_END=2924 /DNA_ORIENTATION=+